MLSIVKGISLNLQQTPPRDKEKLKALKHSLRESAVEYMKKIVESNKEAMEKYSVDASYTRKSIWYADDLLKACQECKQPKMIEFIRKDDKQFSGYLDPKYFKLVKDNVETDKEESIYSSAYYFIAKNIISASAALDVVIESKNKPSIINCLTACEISQYAALRKALGLDRFNRLFSDAHGQPMVLSYRGSCEKQPLEYFLKKTKSAEAINRQIYKNVNGKELDLKELRIELSKIDSGKIGKRIIKKGQFGNIENAERYNEKYPTGHWKCINITCIDDTSSEQRFIGLGLNPNGETELQINKNLLDHYNKTENPFLLDPEKKHSDQWEKMWNIDKNKLVSTYKQLFPSVNQVLGFNPLTTRDFNAELIYDLVQLPLEKVSMDYVKMHAYKTFSTK